MIIRISDLQLHKTLFLGNTNLGDHVKTTRSGLVMVYDTDKQMAYVTFNNQTAMIPTASIASMIPTKTEEPATAPKVKAARPAVNAQVSSPTGHVFGGEGHGKS